MVIKVLITFLSYLVSATYFEYESSKSIRLESVLDLKKENLLFAITSVGLGIFYFLKDVPILFVLKYILIASLVVPCGIYDYKTKRITNLCCICIGVVAILMTCIQCLLYIDEAVYILMDYGLGLVLSFGTFFIVKTISRNGLGYGDVKLMGVLGFSIGISGVFDFMIYTLLAIFTVSMFLLASKRANLKTELPMGPFISIGYLAFIILTIF